MKKLPYQITIFFVVFSLLIAPVAPAFAQEGTPEAPATAITETETPTATPVSETPVVEGTASPTLVPETQTPTPVVTETPTAVPATQVVELQPVLTLRTDPEFLTQAKTVNLIWSLENVSLETQALILEIALPEGFQADETSGTFNKDANTLSIPVATLEGSITLKVNNVREDSLFAASLMREQEVLAFSSIVLPLFEDFEVSKNGGKIDLREGKIKVTFPQGALTEDVVISAGFPSADALPENFSASVFELRAFAKEQESGEQKKKEITRFSEPLTIEVDYSHLTLTEEQEQELFLYWYNPETGDWNALESSRDPQTKTLTAKTDHFTVFDVGVNEWNSTNLPTIDSFQVSEFTGAASFSLPLEVPAGMGGFQPELTLAYNSQVVDQATTKAQASWVGMGWSLDGGGTIIQDFPGFNLNVNGISTKIMVEELYGAYHMEDENFWKIETLGSGNTTYWKLWDKQGNQYTFTNIVNPYSLTTSPYQWNLTQVSNPFGQIMTYNYATESKTVSGESRVTATYVSSIVYPGQRYQVRFAREARTDYTAAWATDAAWHVFERTRLKTVYMEQDADGNGSFETVIRKYEFAYAAPTDTDIVWPGVTYSAGGKTLTLRSVQEFSGSGASLPAHIFNYDNLHLTSASNGYGGGVEFTYEEQPWVYGSTPANYQKSIRGCEGTMLVWGWYAVGSATLACAGEWLNVTNGAAANYYHTNHPLLPENNILRPGGVYQYYYNAAPVTAGATYQTGLYTRSGDANDVQLAASNGATIYLTKRAASLELYFKAVTGTSRFHTMGTWLMPSFYRVETKTTTDGNGHSYTSTHEYTTPTAMINNAGLQFRGHAKVKVTNPDSTYTETTYFQGPYDKGRVNTVCTYAQNGAAISCTDNDYVIVPLPEVDVSGVLDHAWVYQSAQSQQIYALDGTLVTGTKSVYTYNSTYGNLTGINEFNNPTGSGQPYRSTTISYYPNTSLHLTSLPARQLVTNSGGAILSETLNYYNGSNNYTTPPTANKLTKVHVLIDSGQYAQTDYGYDAYGNQTSSTSYTGFSNGSSTPTGAQTSTTVYDSTYRTYPVSVTNAAGQTTALTYNYTLGLPLTQTDPNNAVTKAVYDVFGRVTGVHKPDPVTGSYESSASLTMSYVDSFPFTTTVTQVDTGYQIVKKYDGMGRVTQVNAEGIFTDTIYDSPTITRQSMPYASGDPVYYTTTTVNPNTRTTTTAAPDGTATSVTTNGLTSTITDARGNSTTSISDAWGRTTNVIPPTGPSLAYSYDPLGNLLQVMHGSSSTLLSTSPDNPGTAGLVAWWSMNEISGTRTDSHGTNHLTDVNTVAYASGLNGNAANFVAASQERLTVADNPSISGGNVDFTLVAHVYFNSLTNHQVIMEKGTDAGGFDYRILYNTDVDKMRFRVGSSSTAVVVDSGTIVQPNTWYTVIAWHNAASDVIGIQVNNGVTNTQTFTGGTVDSTTALSIGASVDTANLLPLDGKIDEVAIYKTKLSPAERAWLYNNGASRIYADVAPVNPTTSGLSAWWTMNEVSGTRNDSHNTNHLTDNNLVPSTTGLKGNSASFVTSSLESLSIADNASISTGNIDFTISADVYLNSVASTMVIVNKGDKADMNSRDFTLFLDQATSKLAFRVGNGTTSAVVLSAATVSVGQWYSVIAWHDSVSDTLNIQVNNGSVSTVSYTGGAMNTTLPMSVGAFADHTYGISGRIDEVAMYKRVLSGAERSWLYNNGSGRTYTDLDTTTPPTPNITTLTYNNAGQKLTMDDPDMGDWSYTYDALGNLKTQTDAMGCVLTMSYDSLNRPTNKYSSEFNCGASVNVTYNYDAGTNGIGHRTSMTTSGGISDAWTYDKRGRMLTSTNQGFTTNFTYNNADMLLTMQYPDGETVTYGYNARMLLNSVIGTDTYVSSTTYDSAGRMDQRTLGNSLTQNFDYYAWNAQVSSVGQGGRLQSLLTGSLQDINYQYDAVGNIKNFTDDIASETSTYNYDSLDRLTSWTLGSTTENYTYDSASGNLATKAGTAINYTDTAHKHAATSAGSNTYTYDANGNQITRVIGSDTFNLSYDAENRLVQVRKNSVIVATFVYDGDGNRVRATENGTLTKFIGGHYEVTGSQITKYYFAGASRIAMRKYTIPSSMSVEYLLGDHLGSTSITTDNTGAKVSEMRYKPWGEVRYSWTASTSTTPNYSLADYTFTGQYSYMDDPSTSGVTEGFDLMFYNARWYDPSLGRFAQADSIVPAGVQGYDRYAYVKNSPLNYTDPSGHTEVPDSEGSGTYRCDLDCWRAQRENRNTNNDNFQLDLLNFGNQGDCQTSCQYLATGLGLLGTGLDAISAGMSMGMAAAIDTLLLLSPFIGPGPATSAFLTWELYLNKPISLIGVAGGTVWAIQGLVTGDNKFHAGLTIDRSTLHVEGLQINGSVSQDTIAAMILDGSSLVSPEPNLSAAIGIVGVGYDVFRNPLAPALSSQEPIFPTIIHPNFSIDYNFSSNTGTVGFSMFPDSE